MPLDTGTYTLENILRSMHGSHSASNALIPRAYVYASKAHDGQQRLSGDRYFAHLATTALYLAQAGQDATTVAAGLLHDILEDTSITSSELEATFGSEVAFLVEGVTQIGTLTYRGTESVQENFNKLLQASAQDVRVIVIKLYDRLHNMETNAYHTKDRALRKAEETMNIYVPLAERLGMGKVQSALEDLAFQYIDVDVYKKTRTYIEKEKREKYVQMQDVMHSLAGSLAERYQVVSKMEIREKGIWSLYKKILRKNGDLEDIFDIFAIRFVVSNREACYSVLGTVHSAFKPMPGQFKDYIAFPKPNGYQSLHTTLITPQAGIVEVQIRSRDMHLSSQFGNWRTA